ncbi:hypothetical protein AMATHDRAFT_68993 [Amanita thiersii Skay4041]|uniref:VWFA domain-containing protein n=1 Tax=Amanita thiersii Skay4041 TaxID=703135 RepID=A0A2A9NEZ4_9AGAR|nr:hypothetical protein AMATHDRAFT_68993 [Amanita thiersii Skay4041]
MPLEATMMIIDNSEFMRNGDYQPTRFDAQSDAVTTVFQTKTDSNPENTVGVMTMAGKGPEVLVTHTKDLGQVLTAIHKTSSKIGGTIDIPTAIAIAQLALKHRENKNLRQRIIVFVASPLEGQAADEKAMVKLAKKLKKNNVAVDVVCFGDGIEPVVAAAAAGGASTSAGAGTGGVNGDERKSVLKSFVESVSNGDNSHLLIVPPGAHLLSDSLIASPILAGDRTAGIPEELLHGTGGGGEGGSGTGGGNNFEFGVDPSLDPELAMALRMSMQEAQAREAAEAAAAAAASAEQRPQASSTTGGSSGAPPAATVAAEPTDDEEERLLQQALALSQQEVHGDDDIDMEGGGHEGGEEDDEDEDEDEDEAIQRAIAMSMQDHQPEDEQEKGGKK